jgi:hypothetical protein
MRSAQDIRSLRRWIGERMTDSEQPQYYSDGINPVIRSTPEELFLVLIEARPEPGASEYGEAGGAFFNCWVNTDTLRTAERRAVALIREKSWRPHRFDSWELVTRNRYADWVPSDYDETDVRELVEQAFTDGEACEFYSWPVNAPDSGEDV